LLTPLGKLDHFKNKKDTSTGNSLVVDNQHVFITEWGISFTNHESLQKTAAIEQEKERHLLWE